jgi:hypothetical protein
MYLYGLNDEFSLNGSKMCSKKRSVSRMAVIFRESTSRSLKLPSSIRTTTTPTVDNVGLPGHTVKIKD